MAFVYRTHVLCCAKVLENRMNFSFIIRGGNTSSLTSLFNVHFIFGIQIISYYFIYTLAIIVITANPLKQYFHVFLTRTKAAYKTVTHAILARLKNQNSGKRTLQNDCQACFFNQYNIPRFQ